MTGLLVVGLGGPATANALAAFAGRRAPSPAGPVLVQPHRATRSDAWTGAPGSTSTSDTEVRLDADDPARLALWGTVTDSDLDRSLEMTVVRGSGRGSTFEPDADGVVFLGTLAELPRSGRVGVIDPHVWAPGETNTYRVTVTLDEDAPQGSFATATFSWTASPAV